MLSLLASIDFSFLQMLDEVSNFCTETQKVWALIGSIIRILQIAVPIIIILLGTIDLGKAVMAGDDKVIKESQKMFLKRLIYGVVVFFVVFIVRTVFNLVGNATDSKCWNYAAGQSTDTVKKED